MKTEWWQDLASAAMCGSQNPVLVWISQFDKFNFSQNHDIQWYLIMNRGIGTYDWASTKMSQSNSPNWAQGHLGGGKEVERRKQGLCYSRSLTWNGNSPSLATSPPTIRPWPRWRASGKAGIGCNSWKSRKSLVKYLKSDPKNATFLTGVMTCAARAEPIRVSRRSPMLTSPGPLCD